MFAQLSEYERFSLLKKYLCFSDTFLNFAYLRTW